jgi:hypothetical protein
MSDNHIRVSMVTIEAEILFSVRYVLRPEKRLTFSDSGHSCARLDHRPHNTKPDGSTAIDEIKVSRTLRTTK